MSGQDTRIESIARGLRSRAKASLRNYNVTVVMIVTIVLMLISIFLWFSLKTVTPLEIGNASSFSLVSFGLVRIGAVTIGIFAVQILFSFARYHIRLAHHLESVADALVLSDVDTAKFAALVSSMSPHTIDFGKLPNSPVDKATEIVRELVKKIPDSK
jgi:hypothetical protein